MHGGGGIGNGAHLVGVILFPPVHGGGYIHGDKDHTNEFAVVGAGLAQALGQAQIVGTKDKVAVFVIVGVVTTPGVHGIAGTAHGIVKIGDGSAFQFDHKY